jgi:hypothetical protein
MHKPKKTNKEWHVSNQKIVSGDYNGTAIKQKIGTVKDMHVVGYAPMSDKKVGIPPKSLA